MPPAAVPGRFLWRNLKAQHYAHTPSGPLVMGMSGGPVVCGGSSAACDEVGGMPDGADSSDPVSALYRLHPAAVCAGVLESVVVVSPHARLRDAAVFVPVEEVSALLATVEMEMRERNKDGQH